MTILKESEPLVGGECGFSGTKMWVYVFRYFVVGRIGAFRARYASDTLDTPDTPDTCIGRVSTRCIENARYADTVSGRIGVVPKPPMHPHVLGLLPIHSFGHFVMWVFRYKTRYGPDTRFAYRAFSIRIRPNTRTIRADTQQIRSSTENPTDWVFRYFVSARISTYRNVSCFLGTPVRTFLGWNLGSTYHEGVSARIRASEVPVSITAYRLVSESIGTVSDVYQIHEKNTF